MNRGDWRSVVQSWHEASLRDPCKAAIADGTRQWTRAQLCARAFAWSAQLATLGPAPQNVAIHLPHAADAIAALIGTLAAGHSFVALDPSQPAAQRKAMLDHVEAVAVLSLGEDVEQLRDISWAGTIVSPPAENFVRQTQIARFASSRRACLCFTSGSSAEPKAVSWSHRTLAQAAENLQVMLDFTAADRHALLTPIAVAATPAQIFATLSAGATLHLFEARRSSISELARWLEREGITTLQMVPALFRALAQEAAGRKMWPSLRAVKLGGEGSTVADARLFESFAPSGAVLINGLGLTEAGFNVCWFKWKPGQLLTGEILPIGSPPANLEITLQTAAGPAAIGEVGEMVLRSPALADGYWRDPARTARAYRDLAERAGWRELRAGDAASLREDGLLEHRGRLDDSVKVRGHRVDPAEVESILAKLAGVAAIAVVPLDDGESNRLVGFVQLRSGFPLNQIALRAKAAAAMPDYMVPAEIRRVDSWPRLESGKTDRRALRELAQIPEPAARPPLLDALERTLYGLFSRTLRLRSFAVTDSFFQLGGDSLAAASLFAAIASVLQVDLPLAELVRHPSVAALAERIRATGWNLTDNPVTLLSAAPAPDAVNLFTWPGAGSDVTALYALAGHLGPQVAFFAMQHRGADGRREYDLKVADIAERGVELIRNIQPRGPYALCGTSFGGVVALEVARRFRAAREEVGFLALLDTHAPGYPTPRKGLGFPERLELLLRRLRPIGYKDEPGWEILRRGLHDQRLRFAARFSIRKPHPELAPLPMTTRFKYLQEACFIASRAYRPEVYDGEVHFFSTETFPNPKLFEPDEARGWRPFLIGPLHMTAIPGKHGFHIREPHVRALAEKLHRALRSAMQSASVPRNGRWDAVALWDELAPWWDDQLRDSGSDLFQKVALDALTRSLALRPNERVLDIACGNGWLARRVARAGAEVTAVDISPRMIAQARARNAGLTIDYHVLDATRMEDFALLGSVPFDLAVCNMAIHDLSSIDAIFPGVFSTVREGGRFVLSLVHPDGVARAGQAQDVPLPQFALPAQPRPHIEITRSFSSLLHAAATAGWVLEHLQELPTPTEPALAVLALRKPECA